MMTLIRSLFATYGVLTLGFELINYFSGDVITLAFKLKMMTLLGIFLIVTHIYDRYKKKMIE